VVWLGVLVWRPADVGAGETVAVLFAAPGERVWGATLEVLKREGWGIDRTARPIGLITTKSQRLHGVIDLLVARSTRVRLRVEIEPIDGERTVVRIERELFLRERLGWVEHDEVVDDPLAAPDHTIERALLTAIRKVL
jgi:hypothetical protein